MISECINSQQECTSLINESLHPKEGQTNLIDEKYRQILTDKGVKILSQQSQKSIVELAYESLNKDYRTYKIRFGFVEVQVCAYFVPLGEYRENFLDLINQKNGRFYQYISSSPQLLTGKIKRAGAQKIVKFIIQELSLTSKDIKIEKVTEASFDIIFDIQQDCCFIPIARSGKLSQKLSVESQKTKLLELELRGLIGFLKKIQVADFFVFSFVSLLGYSGSNIQQFEIVMSIILVGKLEDYRVDYYMELFFHPTLYFMSSQYQSKGPQYTFLGDLNSVIINKPQDFDLQLSTYFRLLASFYLRGEKMALLDLYEDSKNKLVVNNTRLLVNLLTTLYNQLRRKDYIQVRNQILKSASNQGSQMNPLDQSFEDSSQSQESGIGESSQIEDEQVLANQKKVVKIFSRTEIGPEMSKKKKIENNNEYLFDDHKKKGYRILNQNNFKVRVQKLKSAARLSASIKAHRNIASIRSNPYQKLKYCLLNRKNMDEIQVFDEIASSLLQLPIVEIGKFAHYCTINKSLSRIQQYKKELQSEEHEKIYEFISSFAQQAGNHILSKISFKLMRQLQRDAFIRGWFLFIKLLLVFIRFLLRSSILYSLFNSLGEKFIGTANQFHNEGFIYSKDPDLIWFQCITNNIMNQIQQIMDFSIGQPKLKEKAIKLCLHNIQTEQRLRVKQIREEDKDKDKDKEEQIKYEIRRSTVCLLKQISKLELFNQTSNQEDFIKFFFRLLNSTISRELTQKLEDLSTRVLNLKKEKKSGVESRSRLFIYNYLVIFRLIVGLAVEILFSIHPFYFSLCLTSFSEFLNVITMTKRLYLIYGMSSTLQKRQKDQILHMKVIRILGIPRYCIVYRQLIKLFYQEERKDQLIQKFEETLDLIKEDKEQYLLDKYRILIGIRLLELSYKKYQFYQYRMELQQFLFQFFNEKSNGQWFFEIQKLINMCYFTQNKNGFLDQLIKLEMVLVGRVKEKWKNNRQVYKTIDKDFSNYFSILKYEDDEIFKTICSYGQTVNVSFYLYLKELSSFVTQSTLSITLDLNREKGRYLQLITAFCNSQTQLFDQFDLSFFQQFHQSVEVQLARSRDQKIEVQPRERAYDNIQSLDYYYTNRLLYGENKWKQLWKRQYENMVECNQFYFQEVLSLYVRLLGRVDCVNFMQENKNNELLCMAFGFELVITKKRIQQNHVYLENLFKRVCYIFRKFQDRNYSAFVRSPAQMKVLLSILASDISFEKGDTKKAYRYLTQIKNSLKEINGEKKSRQIFEIAQRYLHMAHGLYDKESDQKLRARKRILKSMCPKCGYPPSDQHIPQIIRQQLVKKMKIFQRSLLSKFNKFDIHQV